MTKATNRIPIRPETKERLKSILPKSISYDLFIQSILDFMQETNLELTDILQKPKEKSWQVYNIE